MVSPGGRLCVWAVDGRRHAQGNRGRAAARFSAPPTIRKGQAILPRLFCKRRRRARRLCSDMNAGNDTVNAIKQAREFGLTSGGQRLVVGMLLVSDAFALGANVAQGIEFANVFYWNMNPAAAAWSRRFFERNRVMPTEAHAAVYSAVSHYLKSAKAAGTTEVKTVLAKMREIPVDDFYSNGLRIREDSRLMRPAFVARIKKPTEVREPWDLYEMVTTLSPEEAFRPLERSDCPLVAPLAGREQRNK